MGFLSKKNKLPKTTSKSSTSQMSSNSIPPLSKEIFIKKIALEGNRDFTVLRHDLLEGNIMIVNFRALLQAANNSLDNKNHLHAQLQLIKQYCIQNGGSVSKLQEDLLLVTPNRRFKIKAN